MISIYQKILALVLLFLGESLAIYAEMIGARNSQLDHESISWIFLKMFGVFAVAGGLLIAGYMLGLTAFKNIWVVTAVSITSILIIEPIIAWLTFQQLPTTGAVIGFILGALGLLATTLF